MIFKKTIPNSFFLDNIVSSSIRVLTRLVLLWEQYELSNSNYKRNLYEMLTQIKMQDLQNMGSIQYNQNGYYHLIERMFKQYLPKHIYISQSKASLLNAWLDFMIVCLNCQKQIAD